METTYTPVENLIDINRFDVLWYDIPGYRGYQLCSNNKLVRSLKHHKKYPYGIIIENNNGNFILSDSNNNRVKVSLEEIKKLVKENPNKKGYHTWEIDHFSRNPREFVHKEVKKLDQTPRPFQFNIIDK